jgi:hypothetical protein
MLDRDAAAEATGVSELVGDADQQPHPLAWARLGWQKRAPMSCV